MRSPRLFVDASNTNNRVYMLQQLLFLAQIRPFLAQIRLFLAQICGCERYLPQNQAELKAVLKETKR